MSFLDTVGSFLGGGDALGDVATVASAIFGDNEDKSTSTTERKLDPNLKAFSDDVLARASELFGSMEYPQYPGQRSAGPTEWMSYASDLGRNGAAAAGARSWNNRYRAETGDQPYQSPYQSGAGEMPLDQIIAAFSGKQGQPPQQQNTAVSGGPRSDDEYLNQTRGYGRAPWLTA